MIRNKAYGKDKRTNKIAEETEETTWIEENLAIFNLLSKFTHVFIQIYETKFYIIERM